MALIPTERALCNKLGADFSALTQPINAARGGIRQLGYQFEDQLRNTPFSSPAVINAALASFENDLLQIVPGDTLSDVSAVKSFVDGCDYLSDLGGLSSVGGSVLGIFDGITDIITNLGNTVPEFILGSIGDQINRLMQGINFPFGDLLGDLFANADKLISCLDALCGPEYAPISTQFSNDLDQLYIDMNIVSSPTDPNYGKFDYDSLYAKVGLDPVQVANVTDVLGGIDTGNVQAVASVNNTIEAIKNVERANGIGGIN